MTHLGYYLQIDEDEPVMIASLIGWGDVIRWSHKLPPSDSGAIRHFCTFGWEDDFGKLKTELKSCFAKQPPRDTATQETLQNLNDAVVKHKGGAAAVSITDGLGEQGGDAEDAAQTSPGNKSMTPTSGRHSSLLTYAMMPYGTAYAIEPGAGRHIMALLQGVDMAAHIREHQAAVREARASASAGGDADAPGYEKSYEMNGSVAMLSLSGPLTKQVTSMQALLGGTGMEPFAEALASAASDPDAQSIVIVADSPGGTVDGTEELYQCVKDAAAQKPVYTFVPDLCASACYYACCGASAIYAGPTAALGSIGCYRVMTDSSKEAAAVGLEVTVIGDGEMKGAGTDGTPITDAQKADAFRVVKDRNAHFIAAVAKGRKMPVAQARTLADGRVHIGAKAQALGLTDGTMRLSDLVAKIQTDPNAALPVSTAHFNARMGNNNAGKAGDNALGQQEKPMSKALLAGALASLGFLKMSGKAMAAPDDDPQALASAVASEMGAEVEAQVQAREAANPLLSALAGANVTTADALKTLLAEAETGRASVSAVRQAAKEHAIIAYGAEEGKAYAATIDALPAGDALAGYALHMKTEALKKAPADGKKPQTRATQTAGVQYAQDASGTEATDAQAKAETNSLNQTALGRRAANLRTQRAAGTNG